MCVYFSTAGYRSTTKMFKSWRWMKVGLWLWVERHWFLNQSFWISGPNLLAHQELNASLGLESWWPIGRGAGGWGLGGEAGPPLKESRLESVASKGEAASELGGFRRHVIYPPLALRAIGLGFCRVSFLWVSTLRLFAGTSEPWDYTGSTWRGTPGPALSSG